MATAVQAPAGGHGELELPRLERGFARWLRAVTDSVKSIVAVCILATVIVAAVGAPLISPIDPNIQVLDDRLLEPMTTGRNGVFYLLGTDQLGRDVLSRVLYGTRVSLLIGLAAVAMAGTIGVTLGLASGYFGGRVDDVVMRLADLQLALPFILIATFVAAVLGPGLQNTILVLGVNSWVAYARVVRAGTLSIREREYVLAARALGISTFGIIRRYVLPNVSSPILVIGTFAVAQMILSEAALTFLGLGTPPLIPSWGGMLADGRSYMTLAWWTAVFPGLAITTTVIGINLFGDWLRDYLDPKNRELV
jgi:peptide/nickel transport system permease protein